MAPQARDWIAHLPKSSTAKEPLAAIWLCHDLNLLRLDLPLIHAQLLHHLQNQACNEASSRSAKNVSCLQGRANAPRLALVLPALPFRNGQSLSKYGRELQEYDQQGSAATRMQNALHILGSKLICKRCMASILSGCIALPCTGCQTSALHLSTILSMFQTSSAIVSVQMMNFPQSQWQNAGTHK